MTQPCLRLDAASGSLHHRVRYRDVRDCGRFLSAQLALAVFLIGLALGSGLGAMLLRSVRPRLALAWSQVLLTLAIAWTAWIVSTSLPYWPINPLLTLSPWHTFQLDMVRCLWAILPPTILWGASFPLAVAA